MAYKDGEKLIETKVLNLPAFTAVNVSRGDWSLLNSGKSDHYAILRRGPMAQRDWISLNVYRARWITYIEVWQKILPDLFETRTKLYNYVDDLMSLLEYPHLGDTTGTIEDSDIPAVGEPEEMWVDSGPVWYRQTLEVAWDEEIEVSYLD